MERVNVFDYERGCHVAGTWSGGSLSLYDYGSNSHVHLGVSEDTFSGFDYESSTHYSGTVSGSSISLYDYQDGKYYSYSI